MNGIIEISGPLVKAEEEISQAIEDGKHMVVSAKGIPLEEEAELKGEALEKGLLFLGPESKGSIINGNGFGIWNSLKKGPIGIISTSASGAREISCLVREAGISQLLHVGARDLSQKIGGFGTLGAIRFLARDERTEVIVLAALPPVRGVEKLVLEELEAAGKAYVVCFLGSERWSPPSQINSVPDLEGAASRALELIGSESLTRIPAEKMEEVAKSEREKFGYGQKYVRGLFTGGMLCIEAQVVLSRYLKSVHSNTPLKFRMRLPDPRSSQGHACVDLGAPELAGGKEPAADVGGVCERILREAQDWEAATILLDVSLGNGAHQNPAKEIVKAVVEARRIVELNGGHLSVVASIVGTERDPQGIRRQRKTLEKSKITVAPSNAQAATLAAKIAKG